MAKLKIWMVALTLIMGVSLTSCINGDDNTIQPVYGPILLKSTFPYQFQAEGSDVVFEANSATITGLSDNAYPGDMVYLNAQYDTSTQAVDENTKKIIVTVTSAEKLNENTYISQEDVSYNRSVLSTSELGANYSPALYSKNWLIFPIAFYIEKLEMASALKHSFYLVYDAEHEDNNETTMVLRLRHQSNDDASKEKSSALLSKAFKITDLVRNFNGGSTTNKLNTIKIIIQQQKGSTPEIVEGSTDSYTEYTYELDYSKVANL
ncbi:hypothetical protein [Bacteroides cellulosilyticus]|nr:NigD-like C-terminal domain-containing protein [Bacteroides cellulosilyticus]